MTNQGKGKLFDDFTIGEGFTTSSRTITEADIVNFAGLSGDYNPIHVDEEFAKKTPFKTRIAHGLLSVVIASGLVSQLSIYDGTMIALLSQTINYHKPLFIGDTITLDIIVKDKKESTKSDRGIVIFNAKIKNQKNETIIDGDWTTLLKK